MTELNKASDNKQEKTHSLSKKIISNQAKSSKKTFNNAVKSTNINTAQINIVDIQKLHEHKEKKSTAKSVEEKVSELGEKDIFESLIKSIKKGDKTAFMEYYQNYISISSNLNRKDTSNWTILHHAVYEGNLKIVDFILKSNIDIEQVNNHKQTPLHLSVHQGYFDISKKLIEKGALIQCLDDEKNNVLHYCSLFGHLELLKYLLEKSPAYLIFEKNKFGKAPKDVAQDKSIACVIHEYIKPHEVIPQANAKTSKIHIIDTKDMKKKNERYSIVTKTSINRKNEMENHYNNQITSIISNTNSTKKFKVEKSPKNKDKINYHSSSRDISELPNSPTPNILGGPKFAISQISQIPVSTMQIAISSQNIKSNKVSKSTNNPKIDYTSQNYNYNLNNVLLDTKKQELQVEMKNYSSTSTNQKDNKLNKAPVQATKNTDQKPIQKLDSIRESKIDIENTTKKFNIGDSKQKLDKSNSKPKNIVLSNVKVNSKKEFLNSNNKIKFLTTMIDHKEIDLCKENRPETTKKTSENFNKNLIYINEHVNSSKKEFNNDKKLVNQKIIETPKKNNSKPNLDALKEKQKESSTKFNTTAKSTNTEFSSQLTMQNSINLNNSKSIAQSQISMNSKGIYSHEDPDKNNSFKNPINKINLPTSINSLLNKNNTSKSKSKVGKGNALNQVNSIQISSVHQNSFGQSNAKKPDSTNSSAINDLQIKKKTSCKDAIKVCLNEKESNVLMKSADQQLSNIKEKYSKQNNSGNHNSNVNKLDEKNETDKDKDTVYIKSNYESIQSEHVTKKKASADFQKSSNKKNSKKIEEKEDSVLITVESGKKQLDNKNNKAHIEKEANQISDSEEEEEEEEEEDDEDLEEDNDEESVRKISTTENDQKENISKFEVTDNNGSNSPVNETSSIEEKVLPTSFICHALLGRGSFGEVYLVEKINTKILYAMKVLSKDKIMGKIFI